MSREPAPPPETPPGTAPHRPIQNARTRCGRHRERCGPLPELSARPADGDALHQQGRLADADRHALAVLAAGAHAGVELHIVADHLDALQIGRAVADQHGPLEWRAELAIVDLERFGDVEDVLA